MLEIIADIFLAFSNRPIVLLLLIFMGVLLQKELAYQALCLITITIILNVALKGIFQVPLPRTLDSATGYAFPSGHMMVSTVFYIWLALYTPYWSLRILMGIILIGIGASLIYFNFHTIIDVLGGVSFGLLVIVIFIYILLKEKNWSPIFLLICSSVLMLFNWIVYSIVPIDSWRAYSILFACIFLERVFSLNGRKYSFWKFKKVAEPKMWVFFKSKKNKSKKNK